jgi:hypothetical protein
MSSECIWIPLLVTLDDEMQIKTMAGNSGEIE